MIPPADPRRGREPYVLWTLDPVVADAEPKMLVEFLPEADELKPAADGKITIGADPNAGLLVLDPDTGTCDPWRLPRPLMPDTDPPRSLEPDDVCFSPDGQRLAFAARVWDNDPTHAPATLIWTSSLDGTHVKRVTPWDDAVVPMVGG